jgi:hypothetical protein
MKQTQFDRMKELMHKMCLDENMTDRGMILTSQELDDLHEYLELSLHYFESKEIEIEE